MSWVRESGTMPSPLASPRVPRRPTRAWCAEGMRIDPQVSLPMPKAPKLAATAAPVPPLDPPGLRRGSYGLRVWPPNDAMVVIPRASSCMLVLPRTIAPASRRRRTCVASSGGTDVASAIELAVVGMSAVS